MSLGLRCRVVLLLLLLVPVMSASRVDASGLSLAQIALRQSDVPVGYFREEAQYISNEQAARLDGVTPATFRTMGRLNAYESKYGRATPKGMCCVMSEVLLFKDAASVRKGYAFRMASTRARFGGPGFYMQQNRSHTANISMFACNCMGKVEYVDSVDAIVGRYIVNVELHYIPHTVSDRAMLERTIQYVSVIAKRVR